MENKNLVEVVLELVKKYNESELKELCKRIEIEVRRRNIKTQIYILKDELKELNEEEEHIGLPF